jgi:hypothetical protein
MKRVLALAPLFTLACSGESASSGFSEPIRVAHGTLFSGALPGVAATADNEGAPLRVTSIAVTNRVVAQGQGGKHISGLAAGAVAVAMRLMDLGSGYWTVPVGIPSPVDNNQPTWDVSVDFSRDIPAGVHVFGVAPLDDSGNAGVQATQDLCIASRVPDNLSACDPTIAPPDAVISLEWDDDVDLDLVVQTPDGRTVDPKHPTSQMVSMFPIPDDVGVIDRDSDANCVLDGIRMENLVFQKRPAGPFVIYADLFSACGLGAVRFRASVYEAEGTLPDRHLVMKRSAIGELIDMDANGGADPGLMLMTYTF